MPWSKEPVAAEFFEGRDAYLVKMRTREGMKVAKAKGRLRGKQPKLKPAQGAHLVELWRAGADPNSSRDPNWTCPGVAVDVGPGCTPA